LPHPTKSEARIARKNERALDAQEKAARLVESLVASLAAQPKVRLSADPGSIFGKVVRWSCNDPDCSGSWSWGIDRQWSDEDWNDTILPKLEVWSKLTWGEVDRLASDTGHKMHHNMDCGGLCNEALERLIEIEKLDDTIFRFRLGNLPRLWGFRIVDEFHILWFDPTHRVYPVGD
jgi:hypothetical protein